MKLGIIGIGQAGGKIADVILEHNTNNDYDFVKGCLAINTADKDLEGLTYIPEENRKLIGESKYNGNGVGADNEKGYEIMKKEIDTVLMEIDSMPTDDIDAYFLIASLGGGTGSGGISVLAKEMRDNYDTPIYGLGILPAESEGKIHTLNTAKTLNTTINSVDNLLLFDNNKINIDKNSLKEWYNELNNIIANQFGLLFGVSETNSSVEIGEKVVDSSEIINTLDGSKISVIGQDLKSVENKKQNPSIIDKLLGRESINDVESTYEFEKLIKNSINENLSVQVNPNQCYKALIVLSAKSDLITKESLEKSVNIIENLTGSNEVRIGDCPDQDSDKLATSVLLSGLSNVERLNEILENAEEIEKEIVDSNNNKDTNEKFIDTEITELGSNN